MLILANKMLILEVSLEATGIQERAELTPARKFSVFPEHARTEAGNAARPHGKKTNQSNQT